MALNTSADSLSWGDEGEFFEMHFELYLPFEGTYSIYPIPHLTEKYCLLLKNAEDLTLEKQAKLE